jgi:aldose 1-epimerase
MSLPERTKSDHATAEATVEGYPAIVLSSPAGLEASFVPSVGMIGNSLRHHGEELLWQREGVVACATRGANLGIPLLHPWANRLSGFRYRAADRDVVLDPSSPRLRLDPHGLPIHGLLTASPYWEVVEVGAGDGPARLSARLDFAAHMDLLASFPFPHVVLMEVTLRDATLTVRTVVEPSGDVPVPVSFGYHPYLTLPGIAREDWIVAMPVRRRAGLDERGIPDGSEQWVHFEPASLGARTFDDLFDVLQPPLRFTLAGAGRAIAADFVYGYPMAQVYAPPGSDFICFEPMTAPTNALVEGGPALPLVPPGQRFAAEFSITVTAES